MDRIFSFAFAGLLMGLSACDDPASFETRPYEAEFTLQRNYQAVYADTLDTMRLCVSPGRSFFPSPGATTLDAQLYSDLGYGEIRNGISGVIPQTYGLVRIDRAGEAAIVRLKSGRGIGEPDPQFVAWLRYWASSGSACPTIGALQPPTLPS